MYVAIRKKKTCKGIIIISGSTNLEKWNSRTLMKPILCSFLRMEHDKKTWKKKQHKIIE